MTTVQPLPAGWRGRVSPDGRIYYQNDITKRTQWEAPSRDQPPRLQEPAAVPLPIVIHVVVPNTPTESTLTKGTPSAGTPSTSRSPKQTPTPAPSSSTMVPPPDCNCECRLTGNVAIGCLSTAIAIISLSVSSAFTMLLGPDPDYGAKAAIAPLTILLGLLKLGLALLKWRLTQKHIDGNIEQQKARQARAVYKKTSTWSCCNILSCGNLRRARKSVAKESQRSADTAVVDDRLDITLTMAALTDSLFDVVNAILLLCFGDELKSGLKWLVIGAWLGSAEAVCDVLFSWFRELMDVATQKTWKLGYVVLAMTTFEIMSAMIFTFVYAAEHAYAAGLVSQIITMAALTDSLFDVVNGILLLWFGDEKKQYGLKWLVIGTWIGCGETVCDVLYFVFGKLMDVATQKTWKLGYVVLAMTTFEIMSAMIFTFVYAAEHAYAAGLVSQIIMGLLVLLYGVVGVVNCKSGVVKKFRRNADGNASKWLYCGCCGW
eukprot:CAMPEP_0202727070 /NCGR_PEP_ID=MMETSP1385-20130828/184937_1 /ASSEMBLY_ACC=CAM_ASM_000861 /TAXON_ID=933848 /ORGANISM="Elphidium margaritaceum" /LENGTH=487 /DNA_ID=CAMNT_0049393305 /DNA_START=12 /DNA_END=1472 /DNA_ORIENTATION=+